MKFRINYLTLTLVATTLMFSCKQEKKESKIEPSEVSETPVNEIAIIETEIFVLDEHHFNDVPLTSHRKKTKAKEVSESQPEPETYDVHTPEEIHVDLIEQEYVPLEVEVAAVAVPIDETETIVSYSKKGKQTGMLQIVKDVNGDVSKIAFADKNHRDSYNVKTGMSAKEVRKLRRRLKHVVKKSDHYLIDDQSNIMYLLDIADNRGNEITDAEIDKSEVRTIVWEDKHKRKRKKHKNKH